MPESCAVEDKSMKNPLSNLANEIQMCNIKDPGPISQNGNSYSNDASSPKVSWFQISFQSVKPFGHKKRLRILQLPIPYCVSL